VLRSVLLLRPLLLGVTLLVLQGSKLALAP
jgi:hypothetical protein